MGKRKRTANYDTNALKKFEEHLRFIRKPIQQGGGAEININVQKLEEAIKKLPKKDRESIERYWGLIHGTPVRANLPLTRVMKDEALNNMRKAANSAMYKLYAIDYIYLYDEQAENLIRNFMRKINRKGIEEMSNIDAIKYLIMFLVLFAGGEKMIDDGENPVINLQKDANTNVDIYTLLKRTWQATARFLDDQSINMALFIEAIDMFDVKDIIAMKRYVGLPISKEDSDVESITIKTLKDIRLFKEKLFKYGAWDITSVLIYSQSIQQIDISKFEKKLPIFRDGWDKIDQFRIEDVYTTTSEGRKKLECFEIGGLNFTDEYEVMFLFVSREI